jgi:glycosyltransferase involved in cell wall biosynthesis
MKEQPLMSICIATYNRANLIGQTLESIISQVTDEVEIVVVDGASPDETATVVSQLQNNCPQLKYHRLPTKGGVDRDYCQAVSYARGEYCWLLTDDDIVKPNAINTIINLLVHNYSLVVVNAEVWDSNLSHLKEVKHLHIDRDMIYEPSSLETLFVNTVTYLSFIGAVVIKRSLWNERVKEPYIGTEFIHIGVIFQQKLPDKAFVMAEPFISIRYGNAQWSSRFFEIWMIKWPDLIWSFPDISEVSKIRISARHPWKNLHTLLRMRAFGVYSLTEYHRFIKPRIELRWKRFILKAIAMVPGIIPNLVHVIFYKIVGQNDFILWHSLITSRFYYRRYFNNLIRS